MQTVAMASRSKQVREGEGCTEGISAFVRHWWSSAIRGALFGAHWPCALHVSLVCLPPAHKADTPPLGHLAVS